MSDDSPQPRGAPHGVAVVSLGASVLDVGLAGVAVESETRLPPELPLTVHFGDEDAEVALPGRVVWCFFHGTDAAPTGEQRPVYRAGVEFANVLTPQAESLVGFLEGRAEPGGDSRRFGRFRLSTAERIQIQVEADFDCLEIGTETIAIELSLGFEPVHGQTVLLTPRGKPMEITARIAVAVRTDSPERWRLELEVGESAGDALAALRGVVYN